MSYEYWQRTLAGERLEVFADHPQEGFYRARFLHAYVPVAIWLEGDEYKCRIGYDDVWMMRDANTVWTWCCTGAVSYAHYRTACLTHSWEKGEQHGRVSLLDEADKAIALSEDGGELEDLFKKLENARKGENAEHIQAKRLVDAKYKQLTAQLKDRMKELKKQRERGE